MKRTYRFANPEGRVPCVMEDGEVVHLPIFQGILKHATAEMLRDLLARPQVARKYTREAIRKAAWPILREFPRDWLLKCLNETPLRPSRARAIRFLLGVDEHAVRSPIPEQNTA